MTRRNNGKPPLVLSLYHGTTDTEPSIIYKSEEGLDMRFSPGGYWGRALYFAVNSKYSDKYHFPLPDGTKQMLSARVIIGNTIKLKPNKELSMPPLINAFSNDRYDSVTGVTGGSDVYMVYSNKKAYPEYVITY